MPHANRARFPRIPYTMLQVCIDRLHVGTPDAEVEAATLARFENAPDATPEEKREAVRFALACHHENRDLYRRVTSGRL